jgi:cbb3-type cytochrome oxidase subunit 3
VSLTDIVSALNLSLLSQTALVIFIAVFVLLMARLFRPGHQKAHAHAARLALDDAPTVRTSR